MTSWSGRLGLLSVGSSSLARTFFRTGLFSSSLTVLGGIIMRLGREATRNKCIASSNKGLTSSNKDGTRKRHDMTREGLHFVFLHQRLVDGPANSEPPRLTALLTCQSSS